MIQNKALIIVSLVLVGLYVPASRAQEGPALVLKGADIHVKPGQVISSGMLLIRNGRIAEVGRSVTIPEGAEVVDLSGRVLAPLFIDGRNDGPDSTTPAAGWANATSRPS